MRSAPAAAMTFSGGDVETWVRRNLHGAFSVPRVRKSLEKGGVSLDEIARVIGSVAVTKRRRYRKAMLSYAFGGLGLFFGPFAVIAYCLVTGKPGMPIFYAAPFAGLAMVGHAIYLRGRVKAYEVLVPSPQS